MRPLWKGSISFGLVNIPVRLFAATEHKDVRFRTLHEPCRTPLEYRKICPRCRKEVGPEEIVRGYEYEKGRFVIIAPEDLERIPGETTRSIDIVDFIHQEEVDPVYYDRSYYLAPGEAGEKAFLLLEQAMSEAGMAAIARVVLRSRQALALLRPYSSAISLATMFYPDEVRGTAELPAWNREMRISEQETRMARELIAHLTAPFDPQKYTDEYRRSLLQIIEGKIAGEEVVIPAPARKGEVVDLVEALRASIRATGAESAPEGEKPRRRKKVGAPA